MRKLTLLALVLGLVIWCPSAYAAPLLQPGDFIIGIDTDPPVQLESNSPDAEQAVSVLDQDFGSKYLNFGKENSGFIVTPVAGATTVQSMFFVTANDAVARDPASWALYGTNDTITSAAHSLGDAENWTLISQNDVTLPEDRLTFSPLISFSNSTPYTSYRLTFPTLKDSAAANSMQIADVYMYPNAGGTGSSFLNTSDFIIPVNTNPLLEPDSQFPAAEGPTNAIDGDVNTKYLNFGGENSGLITTPSGGESVVTSFQITTANDFEPRDPSSWQLYGTNDAITSTENSQGDAENWILIDEGDVTLPEERLTAGAEVPVDNSTAYTSYRMVFPTMKDPDAEGSGAPQYADIQFLGTFVGSVQPGDFDGDGDVDGADFVVWQTNFPTQEGATLATGDADGDGDVDGADFVIWQTNFPFTPSGSAEAVPEPTAWALAMLGGLFALACRRRR